MTELTRNLIHNNAITEGGCDLDILAGVVFTISEIGIGDIGTVSAEDPVSLLVEGEHIRCGEAAEESVNIKCNPNETYPVYLHIAKDHLALLLEEINWEPVAEGMLASGRRNEPAQLAAVLIGELTHTVLVRDTVPVHITEDVQLRIGAHWHALAIVENVEEIGQRVHFQFVRVVEVAQDFDTRSMGVPDEGSQSAGVIGKENGSLDSISRREGLANVEFLLQLGEIGGGVEVLHAVEGNLGVLVALISADLADILSYIDEVLAVVLDSQNGSRRCPQTVIQIGITMGQPDGDGTAMIESVKDDRSRLVFRNNVFD